MASPTPGMRLLAEIDRLWDRYRRRLKKCRCEPDAGAVHGVRTAARRLLGSHPEAAAALRILWAGERKLRGEVRRRLDRMKPGRQKERMGKIRAALEPLRALRSTGTSRAGGG